MIFFSRRLLLSPLLCFLLACGQKGPLYLEDKTVKTQNIDTSTTEQTKEASASKEKAL